MNSDDYLKALQKYQENLYFNAFVYQQDNAPIHKAVMDYLWAIITERLRKQFLGKI